jgi:AcrR family transcriptional regulator
MTKDVDNCRRARILDAAENVFAACGFEGASLREIVREAQVNLATVYYYFQSKDGLMEAVLKRRFGPLRAEHLELLRGFEHQAGGRPLPIEKILEAMLLPSLRLAVTAPARRRTVTRLIGRIATEPNTRTQTILRRQRAEVRNALLGALQATLPRVPVAELEQRVEFVWGALTFMLCNPGEAQQQALEACNSGNPAPLLERMIGFFAPGFRAPSTPNGATRSRCSVQDPR